MSNHEMLQSEYACKLIGFKANRMARLSCCSKDDVEDLAQELTLRLLRSLPAFDDRKAQPNTFISRVLDRAASSLLRSRGRQRRTERVTDVPQGPTWDRFDFRNDLADALARLPRDLRDLAHRLSERTISEVARELGLPRSTLQRRIDKLRVIFEAASLDDYL